MKIYSFNAKTACGLFLGTILAAGATSCQKRVTPEPGIEVNMDDIEEFDGALVDADTIGSHTFTFGDVKIPTTEVARIFTVSDEIYMSLRAFTLTGNPPVAEVIGAKVDTIYSGMTMQTLAPTTTSTPEALARSFDAIGKNFIDSIVPTTADLPIKAYNIVIDMRPVNEINGYVTYSTYYEYYGGGAHPDYGFYYTTIDPSTAECYDFDTLIKPDSRTAVRKALVETIAQSKNISVDQYLEEVNDFTLADPKITIDNFPVYHVGLGRQGLVFCYPKYSIGPGAEGCPIYVLPIESLTTSLTIKI